MQQQGPPRPLGGEGRALSARAASASADHRWAPQGSLGLVAQWLRGGVLIGQSEHHCTRDCVRSTVPTSGMVIERAVISQSLLIMDMGRPGDAI